MDWVAVILIMLIVMLISSAVVGLVLLIESAIADWFRHKSKGGDK